MAPGGYSGPVAIGKGTQLIFPVPATETVIRLECNIGLCAGPDEARALANRALQKAQDAGNFIDPAAERPRPYVPRGNVKGRADRIWVTSCHAPRLGTSTAGSARVIRKLSCSLSDRPFSGTASRRLFAYQYPSLASGPLPHSSARRHRSSSSRSCS